VNRWGHSPLPAEIVEAKVMLSEPVQVAVMDRRTEARLKGYEGDCCSECGNYTMVRNGTCMKCDTCGSTSGCS
jgi:ribonucleoside-diphosphate reductase alpha chain